MLVGNRCHICVSVRNRYHVYVSVDKMLALCERKMLFNMSLEKNVMFVFQRKQNVRFVRKENVFCVSGKKMLRLCSSRNKMSGL